MTDLDLVRRADALGVSATYLDWRRRRVRVQPDALRAIVDALEDTGNSELSGQVFATDAAQNAAESAAVRPRLPRERCWGFTVQLYSLRSRSSWGHGDLHDLADLAAWSARELGASFVLINPLHAGEPLPPLSDSPYLPMTRRYVSPLYLRIEDIAEYGRLDASQRQRIDQLAAPLRAANHSPELIDRNRVWAAKREALELIRDVSRPDEREAAYRAFTLREGPDLASWAAWCALAEDYGPDWRRWPAGARDPGQAARIVTTGAVARRAEFHAWLQWLLDEQRDAAQRAARAAGMSIGVIGDLAVGAHPGGADAWAHQDLLVQGMSVGAPPDGFNQRGQDWAQPPWHPRLLATANAAPLAELLRPAYRHAGGLRVDHVMGLMRLWWIPEGRSAGQGAYVRYDHRAMVGALTAEAVRAGAIAIGEDLGTVDPWIRRYLAARHVLGTTMLWFARAPDGSPLRRERWRHACLATVGTHDVPPVSAFASGDQVRLRARLGLLKDPQAERRSARLALSAWRDAIVAEGLLAPARPPTADELTVALYGYLARTPAVLVGVSLADAVGDRRTQNVPGTSNEYPNWRIPLCDADGRAVLLEDLGELPLVRAATTAVSDVTLSRLP
jgi:4-alpha-glucanotransferase